LEARSLWTGPRSDPRRYRVDLVDGKLASIGDGGEGLVFRATARFGEQEREVALKMHTSLTLEEFDSFRGRAQALSEIDHPSVMHMIEVFIGTGLVDRDNSPDEAFSIIYTAAEWIPGLSLPVARESTDAASGLRWVSDVARATSYLHNVRSASAPQGVIHRDIKPSNIRVTTDERAVLIDFGIARPHQKGDLTEGAGTYLWRAPEVVGGPGEPGPASDVWGVGALAYWVFMGEPPRLEGAETARKLLIPAADQAGFVDPHGLSQSISKLLETHPKDRPTDLSCWADEFELSMAGRRRRHSKYRPIAFVTAAAVFLIAAAVGVLALGGPSGSSPTKTLSFTFRPQAYPSGLIVDRTWRLSGTAGDHLEGSATLVNGNPGRLDTNYDEVLPEAVAPSVGRFSFTPTPEQVLQSDPVVSYRVNMPGGGTERLSFSVNIPPKDANWSTRLHKLAEAQEVAEAAYLASTHQATPATLKTIQITPSTLALTAGQSKPVTLSGTMSNGASATQATLSGVAWNSSAATTATFANGVIYGLTEGSAVITASAESVTATVSVTVNARVGQSSSSGGTASSPGSSHNSSTQAPQPVVGSASVPPTGSPAPEVTTITPITEPTTTPITTRTPVTFTGSRTANVAVSGTPNVCATLNCGGLTGSFNFGTSISNITAVCYSVVLSPGLASGWELEWEVNGYDQGGFTNVGPYDSNTNTFAPAAAPLTSDAVCSNPTDLQANSSLLASLAGGSGTVTAIDNGLNGGDSSIGTPSAQPFGVASVTISVTGTFSS
jgi:serine/threonine-protein kinase